MHVLSFSVTPDDAAPVNPLAMSDRVAPRYDTQMEWRVPSVSRRDSDSRAQLIERIRQRPAEGPTRRTWSIAQ
jgi:hypothetical protein